MAPLVLAAASTALCLGGLIVVLTDSPTRSAAGLVLVLGAAAAVLGIVDVPFLPGLVVWVGIGGVGLVALSTVLLLNLTPDERGQRRLRLVPAISLGALAWVGAAVAGVVATQAEGLTTAGLSHADVSRALFEQAAVPLTLGLVALAVSVVAAFVLVRRLP